MIQANELRIGNYVNTNNGIDIIKGIFLECLSFDNRGNENVSTYNYYLKLPIGACNPIPLTEELLLKCGFEKVGTKGGYSFDKDKLSIVFKNVFYENGRTYFNSWCILEHSIKYLHQLQNLYFALTQTELQINL